MRQKAAYVVRTGICTPQTTFPHCPHTDAGSSRGRTTLVYLFRHRTFFVRPAAPTNTPRWNARLRRRRGCPLFHASQWLLAWFPARNARTISSGGSLPNSVPQGLAGGGKIVRVIWSLAALCCRYPVTAWPGLRTELTTPAGPLPWPCPGEAA